MSYPKVSRTFTILLSCTTLAATPWLRAAQVGEFEHAVDVGKIAVPGSSEYIAATKSYRITGSGANMWAKEDAFQFLYKKLSGDLSLTMDVAWPETGKDAAAKQALLARTPLGRIGTPEEVAEGVRWLLQDATYTTGQVLRLDGGRLLED